MQAARIPTHAASRSLALWLAMALLFAQWVGLQHKVSHAYLQQEHVHVSSIADIADIDDDGNAGHSCAAFDAATVGDSIHISPFISPLIANAQVLALWAAFISWDAPLASYFSSRAPPLA